MFQLTLFITILVLLFITSEVNARGIWGRKRKTEEVADESIEDTINNLARQQIARKRAVVKPASIVPSFSTEDASALIDTYMIKVNEFIDSPDFLEVMTPETLQGYIDQFSAIPGMEQMFAGVSLLDKLNDPEAIRQQVREGVVLMKETALQFMQLISDPTQLEAVSSNFLSFINIHSN